MGLLPINNDYIMVPIQDDLPTDGTTGVSVHGGFPNPGTDHDRMERSLDLNRLLVPHGVSTYFFRIDGHAWEERGIFHDDIAIVDRAIEPRPWDMVVWWHDGHEQYAVSPKHQMPKQAVAWGVITSTVHQLRKRRA